MTNINQRKAISYALLTVLLWSTVASAFKIALQTLTIVELLLIANVTSVLVLVFIAFFSGRLKHLFSFNKTDVFYAMLFGLLNPFLYYLILFSAYDLLPAQQAQAINYTWGIVLPLLAVPILKQKLTKNEIIGLIIAYFGVLIISSGGSLLGFTQTNVKGLMFALSSTFIWALYWVLNTKQNKDPVCGLLLNFCFGLVFISLYYLLFSEIKPISKNGYMAGIYVGVFEMSLTFYLWLSALRLTDSTAKISSLIFLSPFISFVFIYFLIGEKIKLATIVGLVIIIIGIFVQKLQKNTIKDRR
jgi:drug/metabolite transporter (DMT)-like permease